MLPPGLVLFAQDLPFLERPMAPMLGRVERKMDRAPARKKRAMIRLSAFSNRFCRFFGSAAAHGVTQKPTSLINQGLRHNWQ
jgi:hypothetical protein